MSFKISNHVFVNINHKEIMSQKKVRKLEKKLPYMIGNQVTACHFDSCPDTQMSRICGDKRCQKVGRYPGKKCQV
jgi:hypothetical protein